MTCCVQLRHECYLYCTYMCVTDVVYVILVFDEWVHDDALREGKAAATISDKTRRRCRRPYSRCRPYAPGYSNEQKKREQEQCTSNRQRKNWMKKDRRNEHDRTEHDRQMKIAALCHSGTNAVQWVAARAAPFQTCAHQTGGKLKQNDE